MVIAVAQSNGRIGPVRLAPQWTMGDRIGQLERRVQVREGQSAARHFPAQGVTQAPHVKSGDGQIALSRKVTIDGPGQLRGRREVHEAVGEINRATKKHARS